MGPNVLLVVLDTARADAFEPYGARRGRTPAIAGMAQSAGGAVHPSMFSTAHWTAPAHASLFTGRLPRSVGMARGTPATFKAAMHALGDATLPAALGRSGYDTAGLSANPWVSAASGFDRGFAEFRLLPTDRNTKLDGTGWRDRASWLLQAVRARADDGAEAIEALLSSWLRQPRHQPFFWFVNLMECHSPYLPPKPYTPYGPVGRLEAALDAARHCTVDALWRVGCGGWDIDDDALDRMRSMYLAAIGQLDHWMARVFDALDAARVLDDTLVIVTSDHGENLGEDHKFGHVFSLDNRLLHVPFVTRGPVTLDLPSIASIADVPLALLRAVGVDAEAAGFTERDDEGVVVAQLDAVGVDGDPRVDAAIERWGLGDEAKRIATTSYECATDGRYKLVRRDGREELFDLATDPLETNPVLVDASVAEREAGVVAPLRAALDRAAAAERAAPTPATGDSDGDSADADADLEARMRLLGYL